MSIVTIQFATLVSILSICVFSTPVSAQEIKLEEIMKGEDFVGHSPVDLRWAVDGQLMYFEWNPNSNPGNSTYGYPFTNFTVKEMKTLTVPEITPKSTVYTKYYYNENGNLTRYNLKSKNKEIVYSDAAFISNVQRVNNLQHIYFEHDNNLIFYNEVTGTHQQFTNFIQGIPARKNSDTTLLTKQQLELFLSVRRDAEKTKWNKAKNEKRAFPVAIHYEKDEQLESISISPNERFVTFRLSEYPDEPATHVEEYITADGYTKAINARPKVGEKDPKHRLGIYDKTKDTSYFVSFSSLSNIRKRPAYLLDYNSKLVDYEQDRSLAIHTPVFHIDGKTALVDIISYDNKDRWIVLLDLATGSLKELEHQHDEAWIGGPGISSYNDDESVLGWLDGNEFYFQSEETGFSHLYKQNANSGSKKALTSGNWEVHDVTLSQDKKTIYFIANKIHPGVRNGYKLAVNSGAITPLFEGNFAIEWVLSPDEKKWAIRYSTSTRPWDVFQAANLPNAKLQEITKSQTEAYKKLKLLTPEVIKIPTSDGKSVYARQYKPENPNRAAVLFVHGAGYLQNAHYYWSNYYREFLFHQLLVQKGYTVLDVDYRASEGYGRDVRTAVYRHMGERDLLDYVDAKKYAVEKLKIDNNRVGIYGGSYGGFITLMAMLKTPGQFACGAALRSVTDWQHYNHEYTSNILNTPATDPIAYKRSSPIYFAEGLNGPLLMLHGIEDDNVQFQDIVRMNQRFIELGKDNFELASFPTEAHGFKSAEAWTDEYKRILKLFETHLKK